jgi:hypothetical protein
MTLPFPDLSKDEDQAYVLSPGERWAIRDARLLLWMIKSDQIEMAIEFANQDVADFWDELEALADRVEHGQRVSFKQIKRWAEERLKERGGEDGIEGHEGVGDEEGDGRS